MSRNRYVSDYRIVESIDERGRIRSDYEYIGPPYHYAGSAETVRAARRGVTACCIAGWAGYIAALLPLSTATRTPWVSLPFIFAAIPLALLAGLCWRLHREKEPFEHRHADQLENRGPACTFSIILLSGIALAGEAVNALRGASLLPGDGVFCAGAALLAACGWLAHARWKRLGCRTAD